MDSGDSAFLVGLARELMASSNSWFGSENWDAERFGAYRRSVTDFVLTKCNRWSPETFALVPRVSEAELDLSGLTESLEGLSCLYTSLADDASKSMLLKVLAYRLLGPSRVRLPLNTPAYWSQRKELRSFIRGTDGISVSVPALVLNRVELDKLGYPVDAYLSIGGVMAVFVLRQYEYRKRTPAIAARAGDYVIDGGGCWGDTSLYFAQTVGANGRVYAFEFNPDNLEIFQQNMVLNPVLAERIDLIPKALWDVSGEVKRYTPHGPGTSMTESAATADRPDSREVTTVSIDDFVSQHEVPRVDYIKMDIEGAELSALTGAEETIRTFTPKLAISIYHREDDFIAIPSFLQALDLGYKMFMDHFTIYGEETVLFAEPSAK